MISIRPLHVSTEKGPPSDGIILFKDTIDCMMQLLIWKMEPYKIVKTEIK
jgi:hypothetical protein